MTEETELSHKKRWRSIRDRFSSRAWWGSVAGKLTALTALIASIVTILVAIPSLVLFFQPKSVDPPATELQRTPELGLEFWEGGKNNQYPMTVQYKDLENEPRTSITHVVAKSASFEIRFPTLKHVLYGGAHICAWTDDSIFNIKAGTDFNGIFNDTGTEDISALESCFTPGKGMANTQAGDAILPISNKYNSYWVDNRVDHISDTKDRIFISKADDQLLSQKKGKLYLSIWIDGDVNHRIDLGEYEYVVIDFV